MPIIRMEYDDSKVSRDDAFKLASAVQKIVADVTEIEDVAVYANSATIKVKVSPIEIFIEMSAYLAPDLPALLNAVKAPLGAWKEETNFPHIINLTVIPMTWKFETGI